MTDAINILVNMQPGGDAVARQRAAAAAAAGEGGEAAAATVGEDWKAIAGIEEKVVRCGGAEPARPGCVSGC